MKKYVVTWEDDVVVICKTRADAEEYIFSEVEEIAYEAFLDDLHIDEDVFGDSSLDLYFSHMRHDLENENKWRMTYNHPRPLENLYAYILNCNTYGWYIHEVEELE